MISIAVMILFCMARRIVDGFVVVVVILLWFAPISTLYIYYIVHILPIHVWHSHAFNAVN